MRRRPRRRAACFWCCVTALLDRGPHCCVPYVCSAFCVPPCDNTPDSSTSRLVALASLWWCRAARTAPLKPHNTPYTHPCAARLEKELRSRQQQLVTETARNSHARVSGQRNPVLNSNLSVATPLSTAPPPPPNPITIPIRTRPAAAGQASGVPLPGRRSPAGPDRCGAKPRRRRRHRRRRAAAHPPAAAAAGAAGGRAGARRQRDGAAAGVQRGVDGGERDGAGPAPASSAAAVGLLGAVCGVVLEGVGVGKGGWGWGLG